MSLKNRAVNGAGWNFLGSIGNQLISLIIGIVLARLLTPTDYGTVGIVTIFISLTLPFVNSGFGQALIRQEKVSELQLSSVFYFNLIASLLFYFILIALSPAISQYFKISSLNKVIPILGLVLIIDSLSIIHSVIYSRKIDFKTQTKTTILSTLISGLIGFVLAYLGFGIWAIVIKTLLERGIRTLLFWVYSKWRPLKDFSFSEIKKLANFSFKLLLSDIVDKVHANIYYIFIGRYFSPKDLGLYTRGKMFNDIASQNISESFSSVFYPVLASFKNDSNKLRESFRNSLMMLLLLVSFFSFTLYGFSEPLVKILLGDKWLGSIFYIKILSFVSFLYPLHVLSRDLLLVLGDSKKYFNLELVNRLLSIPVIIIGIKYGIEQMLYSFVFLSFIDKLCKIYFSGKAINYSMFIFYKDIKSIFVISIIYIALSYLVLKISILSHLSSILILTFLNLVISIIILEKMKFKGYLLIRDIIFEKMQFITKKSY